jgi:hypothetical protein
MLIPPAFAAGIEAGAGADGKAWLDALRLHPDRSLTALPVAAAAVVAARLLRRLAIDCPPELPSLARLAGESARRLDAIVGEAGLDPATAGGWTLVRTIHYWLWALGVGLTDDPVMCRSLSEWLAG